MKEFYVRKTDKSELVMVIKTNMTNLEAPCSLQDNQIVIDGGWLLLFAFDRKRTQHMRRRGMQLPAKQGEGHGGQGWEGCGCLQDGQGGQGHAADQEEKDVVATGMANKDKKTMTAVGMADKEKKGAASGREDKEDKNAQ